MSQLYVTGNVSAWPSQTASAGFLDSHYYILLAGSMSKNSTNSAIAVRYTNSPSTSWLKAYSGPYSTSFAGMVQLADGSYMATGTYFLSGDAGDENMWLVNIDQSGNKTWDTQIGQHDMQTDGAAIVATPDGGFATIGTQISGETISTLIYKYNADKTVAWQKSVENVAGFSINTTNNGYIISGRETTTGLNSSPVAILIDANGNTILNNIFTDLSLYILRNTDAIQTADGNFVLVAQNIILKFNDSGTVLWSVETANGSFTSVAEKANGDLVIGGATIVASTSQSYVVVTDSNGENIIWDNSETLGPSSNASVFIDPRADGGVVWTAGTITISAATTASVIVYTAYNPTTTLAANSGTQSYAFADTSKQEAVA